jgi:hypothetical protein
MESHTVYVGALKVWAKYDDKVGIVLTPFREGDRPHGNCPICHTSLTINERYPDYLCGECADRAVDARGRPLQFYNTDIGGGFEARFTEDGSLAREVSESHVVYVGFLKVWADEARFGGTVLTPFRKKN